MASATAVSTSAFVLIHSPLVGPSTWQLVARQLSARGFPVLVPALAIVEHANIPAWKQAADSVPDALRSMPVAHAPILVGHSGAGPLLPAIRQAMQRLAKYYIFIDASIPRNNASYLDLLTCESPEQAEDFRQGFSSSHRYPTWTDEELADVIPNTLLRR